MKKVFLVVILVIGIVSLTYSETMHVKEGATLSEIILETGHTEEEFWAINAGKFGEGYVTSESGLVVGQKFVWISNEDKNLAAGYCMKMVSQGISPRAFLNMYNSIIMDDIDYSNGYYNYGREQKRISYGFLLDIAEIEGLIEGLHYMMEIPNKILPDDDYVF